MNDLAVIAWPDRPAGVELPVPADGPVRLVVSGVPLLAAVGRPLVDVFTSVDQRARSSAGHVRSAIGERLRLRSTSVAGDTVEIVQGDVLTGLEVTSRLRRLGPRAFTGWHTVRNVGARTVVLTAVTGAGLLVGEEHVGGARLSWAESGWLAENRWRIEPLRERVPEVNLPLHGQDGRASWGVTSHGAWSTGDHLPMGVLSADGGAVAFEIESSGPWHWELGESLDGVHVTALGPTGARHGFAVPLAPGREWAGTPVTVAWSSDGHDAAVGALIGARRAHRLVDLGALPVVYNDFMNTLMGDPTAERLHPLVDAAADAGAEVFCVDAGWFAADGDWWHTVGEWREAAGRFPDGLAAVLDRIRTHGMLPGLWVEPEVVGVASPVRDALPEEAFLRRDGSRVVEHDRYHLDLRHPAAVAHLDAVVDRLVADYGIGFLKLDYNIDPGADTALVGHAHAYREWLTGLVARHPGLILENCASGAMRADPALLRVSHLQSTSDQQDFRRYPPIAAAAPMTIPPEQAGNWAYPAPEMTGAETAFAMLAGITGRLYLSGFLHRLRPEQRALVHEAVELHKRWRRSIAESVPSWPLGLPGWSDSAVALRLDGPDGALLAVWSRGHDAEIRVAGQLVQLYPVSAPAWPTEPGLLHLPAGYDARLFLVTPI
ncbi:alpha-galactosidase [Catenuloplanes nepalensis]|uniref:Alpha-galactosidase n=1 Tax=Catenuloplanes nepalensis TaxID=587533 RepID=A0ABT9MNL4_9ACTN|nr:glycoside hydrolase family 36 protein [Catenuloplanes nepalensis]MDP9793019.1 alpha-galactosidase [Catenuloplanes nepalensis]